MADHQLNDIISGEPDEVPSTPSPSEDSENKESKRISQGTALNTEKGKISIKLYLVKVLIGCILFLVFGGSSVLSKLTLIGLTGRLRRFTHIRSSDLNVSAFNITTEDRNSAVTLYWHLLLIVLIPNIITFLRCLVVGVLGKTTKSFPWPRKRACLFGFFGSVIEVSAISAIVFLVLPNISSGIGIWLFCGVFLWQGFVDICILCKKYIQYRKLKSKKRKNDYESLNPDDQHDSGSSSEEEGEPKNSLQEIKSESYCKENCKLAGVIIIKILGMTFQVVGIIGLIIMIYQELDDFISNIFWIEYIFPVIALSIIWSNAFQKYIAKPVDRQKTDKKKVCNLTGSLSAGNKTKDKVWFHQNEQGDIKARFKSGFINSGTRLLFYPFVSYVLFRYRSQHHIDPWCLQHDCDIKLSGEDWAAMSIQVVFTLLGYITGWVACTMTLRRFSFAVPLLMSTPVTVLVYYMMTHIGKVHHRLFPYFTENVDSFYMNFETEHIPIIFGTCMWLGEILVMIIFLLTKTNKILSRDSEMFLVPHYDGVFFEQHLIMNQQRKKNRTLLDRITSRSGKKKEKVNDPVKRKIFICSTMYRENETEMGQMLSSIYNIACHDQYPAEECDSYESHIFFDGGVTITEDKEMNISEFGLQLLSLLEKKLHVRDEQGTKEVTPYGCCYTWDIGPGADSRKKMRFSIHFKDNKLVKAKKRWSQVMYMNYVINHRIKKKKEKYLENTFIMTTDADIHFTPHSADVLLDMLDSNPKAGAVCARTHPKGHGLMYWYQIFEYAIGHWFQKPAEHILGCVLCSPGCFSVFRCSALNDVLEEYSSEAETAAEFLMKDMGEDRWLCTLLIKAGWRLEYCAISEDETYCPVEFGEFYKQRRRWIPSTVANIAMIIAESMKITRGNDSVSIFFILFQAIIFLSTAISPATVILVITSGLNGVFYINDTTSLIVITLLVVISVLYGAVCVAGSPQTQIDLAKVLTFIFAVVMSLAFIGIFKNTIESIVNRQSTSLLNPPICNKSITIDYEACIRSVLNLESVAHNFKRSTVFIPVSTNAMYLAALVLTFLIAALLHIREFYCILHGVWYIIGLPSGYLFLVIYSAANLDNQSWGTREAKQKGEEDNGLFGWWIMLKSWLKKCARCCLLCKGQELLEESQNESLQQNDSQPLSEDNVERQPHAHVDSDPESLHAWLQALGFEVTIEQWLERLNMTNYTESFNEKGCPKEMNISNLKESVLKEIEVTDREHRQKMLKSLRSILTYKFWRGLIETVLKPVVNSSQAQAKTKDLHLSLRSLRNITLGALFLINISWIILLYSLSFPQLEDYGLQKRSFDLLFLAVYSFIIVVQFIALICHRLVSLVHYLGRTQYSLRDLCRRWKDWCRPYFRDKKQSTQV